MRVHRLTSASGVAVSFIPVGGAIVAILAPDRNGRLANVVLAHADLETYRTQRIYLGAVCGRYANRVADHLQRIGCGEIGHAVERAALDQRVDHRVGAGLGGPLTTA